MQNLRSEKSGRSPVSNEYTARISPVTMWVARCFSSSGESFGMAADARTALARRMTTVASGEMELLR